MSFLELRIQKIELDFKLQDVDKIVKSNGKKIRKGSAARREKFEKLNKLSQS